jgi:hypothetical protein
MGYRTGSRRSGQRFQKSQHEKAKTKTHKHTEKAKFEAEEREVSPEQVVKRTLDSLKRLGEQTFAISPFSQYFDDWLVNLKDVASEFESSQGIEVDETFAKDREQIITKVECELNALKQEENTLTLKVKELADNNHKLVELDAEYAAKTRELGTRKNEEVQNLTKKVHEFEDELAQVKNMKTSFFGFTKKAKVQKETETCGKLECAKTDLEAALEKFKVEQEKLHDEYAKKKQTTIKHVQALENEVAKLESDPSTTSRRTTGDALIQAVNALFQRKPAFPNEPTSP